MISSGTLRLNLVRVAWFTGIGFVVGGVLGQVNYMMLHEDHVGHVVRGLIGGFLVGVTIGTVEVSVFYGRMRRKHFPAMMALRTLAYAGTMIVWLTAVNVLRVARAQSISATDAVVYYIVYDTFRRDFVFITLTVLIFVWILQIMQLHRGRDLLNFILGRYNQPREVERVFLFVDLSRSTSIAEELGHLAYSAFIQDFFFDLDSAVLRWRGDVYQYVGDEIIVTWPIRTGTVRAGCVECFFAMQDEVEKNRHKYLERYGVCPTFTGGLHAGVLVVTWVGGLKKEIVYHGDVLNTTARIQAEAKRGSYPCLVSGELLGRLSLPEAFAATEVGTVSLRGRKETVLLHAVERMGALSSPS